MSAGLRSRWWIVVASVAGLLVGNVLRGRERNAAAIVGQGVTVRSKRSGQDGGQLGVVQVDPTGVPEERGEKQNDGEKNDDADKNGYSRTGTTITTGDNSRVSVIHYTYSFGV